MSDSNIYACARCGAIECKLWRSYSMFDPDLKCVDCSCVEQKKPEMAGQFVEEGWRPSGDDLSPGKSYEIEWRVPAVQIKHMLPDVAYWGYTSIPISPEAEHHQDWLDWEALPLRMTA